jgi:hypothetical protein
MEPDLAKKVVGTWRLVAHEMEHSPGIWTPWGQNLRGYLIYAPTGHMSVAINRDQEPEPAEHLAETTLGGMIFYAGPYRAVGTNLFHDVEVASRPSRVGVTEVREAELIGDRLILRARGEGWAARITWQRIQGL